MSTAKSRGLPRHREQMRLQTRTDGGELGLNVISVHTDCLIGPAPGFPPWRGGLLPRPFAISTKNKHLLAIYSIPARGFTAAVSGFEGTPPPKPLNCKIRFASAVIGPRHQGPGEGRKLNDHFHGRCERRRDVRVAGASLGGYRHRSPSRGKVLVMPAKPAKSQMPVWQS
jgi:hypothetical protein